MNARRLWVFWLWVLFVLLVWQHATAWGQTAWNTQFQIRKAKQAMSLGMLKRWKTSLDKAESLLKKEGPRMPLPQRNNAQMWIWLLRSKYYRFKGEFPPIVSIKKFEDKAELSRYIRVFRRAIKSLETSRVFLKQYIRLFSQMMERSKWRNQIYLQASLSLQRDLEGSIRSGKMYVSFLDYASHNWGNVPKIRKQLKKMSGMVEQLDQDAAEAKVKALLAKRKRRRLAQAMIQTQRKYVSSLKTLKRQKRVGQGLVVGGSIGLVAGGAMIGVAVYFLVAAHMEGGDIATKQMREQVGWPLVGAGIGVAALSLGLLTTGLVVRPGQTAIDHATIRNHNRHLEMERKEQEEKKQKGVNQSVSLKWLPFPGKGQQVVGMGCTTNCITFGRW